MLENYSFDSLSGNITAKVVVKDVCEYTGKEIQSFTIDETLNGDSKLSVGNVISSTLSLSLINIDEVGDKNEVFTKDFGGLVLYVYVSDGVNEVPLGKYYVDKAETTGLITKITAYDILGTVAFTTKYTTTLSSTEKHTLLEYANDIHSSVDVSGIEGLGELYPTDAIAGSYTRRELIGNIAGCYGKNVKSDRFGNVIFVDYADNSTIGVITADEYFTNALTANEAPSMVNRLYANASGVVYQFSNDNSLIRSICTNDYQCNRHINSWEYVDATDGTGCIEIKAQEQLAEPTHNYIAFDVCGPCTLKIEANATVHAYCCDSARSETVSHTISLEDTKGLNKVYITAPEQDVELYSVKVYREITVHGVEVEIDNSIMSDLAAQNLWNTIQGRQYRAIEIDFNGNPLIESGDRISIIDKDGNTIETVVFSQTMKFNGALSQHISTTTDSKIHEDKQVSNSADKKISDSATQKVADKVIDEISKDNSVINNTIIQIAKQEVCSADVIESLTAFSEDVFTDRIETNLKAYKCIPNIENVGGTMKWIDEDNHTYSCSNHDSIRGYISIEGINQKFIEAHLVVPDNYNKMTLNEVQELYISQKQVYYTSVEGDQAFSYFTFVNPKSKYPDMADDYAEMHKVYIRKTSAEYVKKQDIFTLETVTDEAGNTSQTYNVVSRYGVGDGDGRGTFEFRKDGNTGKLVYRSRTTGEDYGLAIDDNNCTILRNKTKIPVISAREIESLDEIAGEGYEVGDIVYMLKEVEG